MNTTDRAIYPAEANGDTLNWRHVPHMADKTLRDADLRARSIIDGDDHLAYGVEFSTRRDVIIDKSTGCLYYRTAVAK